MSYVSTYLNRHYAALESAYGTVPAIGPSQAFRSLSVELALVQQYLERRDKSGSRSFTGVISAGRRQGRFQAEAYLMSGGTAGQAPNMAPFCQCACGGVPLVFAGGSAAAGSSSSQIVFSAAHGLAVGQAIGFNGELRFVTQVPNSTTVTVDPAFSAAPTAGATITGAVTYPLATGLPSLSIFDYWDPASAQQRILAGAAVNQMQIEVQGDLHTVRFSGEAQDLIDSITFAAGQGGLAQFPTEPSTRSYAGDPIAGHLGQVWLGATPAKFQSVLGARLELDNGLELRKDEVGSAVPLGIAPGARSVTLDFELYETDDTATRSLYTASRNRTPVVAFLQLGGAAGHLFGAYMKSLVPQPPANDPAENQLKWSFRGARAGGSADDELWIAFG